MPSTSPAHSQNTDDAGGSSRSETSSGTLRVRLSRGSRAATDNWQSTPIPMHEADADLETQEPGDEEEEEEHLEGMTIEESEDDYFPLCDAESSASAVTDENTLMQLFTSRQKAAATTAKKPTTRRPRKEKPEADLRRSRQPAPPPAAVQTWQAPKRKTGNLFVMQPAGYQPRCDDCDTHLMIESVQGLFYWRCPKQSCRKMFHRADRPIPAPMGEKISKGKRRSKKNDFESSRIPNQKMVKVLYVRIAGQAQLARMA